MLVPCKTLLQECCSDTDKKTLNQLHHTALCIYYYNMNSSKINNNSYFSNVHCKVISHTSSCRVHNNIVTKVANSD